MGSSYLLCNGNERRSVGGFVDPVELFRVLAEKGRSQWFLTFALRVQMFSNFNCIESLKILVFNISK